ncbi:OLC1v1009435C1 [Oldenlandia corymbosa var. corymbosa]|uniref:OLC1v1009435C1 n=1 Tax=Oldenlandia corymbosa var. corymbosa TaxID=529605 RepID=A0AAV1DRD0_OLDCO|nr:OLC1v1009435C1 [Oldenlandia corymbosa var. corymbosa]
MAGSESQKQLFSLIRDFASEKSHGERKIINLKNRIEELRSELREANEELEDAKVRKESTEQELKGYEVELTMNQASIQTLEARIVAVQDEISEVGSDVEKLKNEGGAYRDDFIKKMMEFNACLRNLQGSVASLTDCNQAKERTRACDISSTNKTEFASNDLESKLAQIIFQTDLVEQEYQRELDVYKLAQQELTDLERKVSLMGEISTASAELRELARYPSIYCFLHTLYNCIAFSEHLE